MDSRKSGQVFPALGEEEEQWFLVAFYLYPNCSPPAFKGIVRFSPVAGFVKPVSKLLAVR